MLVFVELLTFLFVHNSANAFFPISVSIVEVLQMKISTLRNFWSFTNVKILLGCICLFKLSRIGTSLYLPAFTFRVWFTFVWPSQIGRGFPGIGCFT